MKGTKYLYDCSQTFNWGVVTVSNVIFQIKHQYRLTSETGPAHKKVFTVTLRLGDTEEYTAEVKYFNLN